MNYIATCMPGGVDISTISVRVSSLIVYCMIIMVVESIDVGFSACLCLSR